MKKLAFSVLILLIFSSTYSQRREVIKNRLKLDNKRIHFGFTVGLNSADFVIRNSDNFFDVNQIDQIYSIENTQSMGFHLGPVSNLKLGRYFDLRFLIDLTFDQRDLEYMIIRDTLSDGSYKFDYLDMKLASTFIEFPLLLKYKARRINNYQPYIITGANFKMDLASKKKIKEDEIKIRLNQPDLYYEIGFGIDFFTTYFKFSPELKFGAGLLNVMKSDATQYTSSIKYLKSNIIMLSFHFEG